VTAHTPQTMLRLFVLLVLAALGVLAAGCGGQDTTASGSAVAPLKRPCDARKLRLDGTFLGSLGSQFGAVTISTSGPSACQLRGGRPKVLVYVRDSPIPLVQSHTGIPPSDGPSVLTVPVAASDVGPGFRFEWQETCRPKGPISVRVQFPGTNTSLPVAHKDRIAGPRCTRGVKGRVVVSLLGRDVGTIAI
jgi:hypothetical protein